MIDDMLPQNILNLIDKLAIQKEWRWDSVRSFFETHIGELEIALIKRAGD